MSNNEKIEEWDWGLAKPTGLPVDRREAHAKGIAHEGVHLWIVRDSDNGPELLFQRRAHHKDSYPGYFDITVGGHVPYGLTEGKVQKEAREELGIDPPEESLISLGCYRYEEHEEQGRFHREFQQVYLLPDARPLDEYSFADGEVDALCAVPVDDLKRMMLGSHSFSAVYFNGKIIGNYVLTEKDFHPLLFAESMKAYMEVLLDAVDVFFSGKGRYPQMRC